tara:strand:- start:1223 stop:1777 length:555 start_codon:yes stop_codon:yes gene_type:complete
MELCNFVFKPNNIEIAKKVLGAFGNNWLNWDQAGCHAEWSDYGIPDGYIKLSIESESPIMDEYSEICYYDNPVTSRDLTEHMMIVLDQAGAFDAPWINDAFEEHEAKDDERIVGWGTKTPKYYCFEEVELSEIIGYLQANNSRSISFWSDRVWVREKDHEGASKFEVMNLIDYVMNAPFTKKAA